METPKLIYSKISKIMVEMDAVPKSKDMQEGPRYKYRSIDQIKNATNPLLAKHGVFYCPKVKGRKTTIKQTKSGTTMSHYVLRVLYTLYAEDGSFIEAEVYGEASDSSDKGIGKAESYAEKVMLCQVFNIPFEDQEDPDHERKDLIEPPKTVQKPAQIKKPTQEPRPVQKNDSYVISEGAEKRLRLMAKSVGWQESDLKEFLEEAYGCVSTKDILKQDYNKICEQITFGKPKK